MAAAKTVARSARDANADMQIRFYFGDALATPPNALRVEVTVASDGADGSLVHEIYDRAVSLTPLTGAERTSLAGALTTVRNAALAALGFV
jgi:hypothetical protein